MVGLFCMDGSGLASIYSHYGLFSGLVFLHVIFGLSRYAYLFEVELFEVESEYCIIDCGEFETESTLHSKSIP
jgi:hypothetical protein